MEVNGGGDSVGIFSNFSQNFCLSFLEFFSFISLLASLSYVAPEGCVDLPHICVCVVVLL